MKNTFKLSIIAICLSLCISCVHRKPVATPEEVNEYLDKVCYNITERSNFDLLDLNDNDNVII